MKDRTLLLAGLVEEDDLDTTRYAVVESYEEQLEKDRKNISEQVSFVEEDETRLTRLIGESEEEKEWEGKETLNEGIALGGLGPGFAGAPSYALSSHYTPSQSEAFGQILGNDYHKNSKFSNIENPRAALFQKIAEMNPGAFALGSETINELELPEFDENFNPIISEEMGPPKEEYDSFVRDHSPVSEIEMGPTQHYKHVMNRGRIQGYDKEEYPEIPGFEGPFNFKGRILYYDKKEGQYYDQKSDLYIDNSELTSIMEGESKMNNGDVAVQGGIGPGFAAYDGIKEIKNPYENAGQDIMSRWYLGETSELDELKKSSRKAKIKTRLDHAKKVMDQTEKRSKERRQELDELGSMDIHQLSDEGEHAHFGHYLMKNARKALAMNEHQLDLDELASIIGLDLDDEKEHELMYEVIGLLRPHYEMREMDGRAWIIGTDALMQDLGLNEMKEQPDLPGELYGDLTDIMGYDEEPESVANEEELYPKTINLATANLTLVGEDQGNHVYQIDNDDAMIGISKDVEGYYAQIRDAVTGLAGEGYGNDPVSAAEEAMSGYTGNQQEMPSTLAEQTVEGTDGSPWFYRRTGTPDGYNLRFREDGKATMHPEAPEEPSSEGWPGLKGWQFYDADHTKQKMDAQMDDVLDSGEADAIEKALNELFSKNSTFDDE